MDQDTVTKFATEATALIGQLGELAAKSDKSEEELGMVRQLRVSVGALVSACDAAGRPSMSPRPPMRQAQAPTQGQAPAGQTPPTAPTSGRRGG